MLVTFLRRWIIALLQVGSRQQDETQNVSDDNHLVDRKLAPVRERITYRFILLLMQAGKWTSRPASLRRAFARAPSHRWTIFSASAGWPSPE